MRLDNREESENVDDRRGIGMPTGVALGGGSLLLAVVLLFLGVDPRQVQQIVLAPQQQQQQPGEKRELSKEEQEQGHFTKVIFHDTEVIWGEQFKQMGKTYPEPELVLYSGMVDSACGQAEAAVGPFYCPGDAKVYIDTSFYTDMQKKLNAPGDFARAYVVAHEVGHHVQKLLGYARFVDRARATGDKVEANRASVRLELQADYLAGVWANHGQEKFKFLDPGDIDSALNAAFEIGDDRLQKKARGYVVPDAFTHGTSKQRMKWFSQGFKTGDVDGAKQIFDLDYDSL